VGIIGCGQLGTMLLTKLLETQSKPFYSRPVREHADHGVHEATAPFEDLPTGIRRVGGFQQ